MFLHHPCFLKILWILSYQFVGVSNILGGVQSSGTSILLFQINKFSNIHVPLEFALRNSISLEILEPNNQPEFNTVGYHFSDWIPGIGSN